jgi:alkanesulfonate monooxygenase SsuD/methylene tetrahydromethanopterin reductase-like flavin-dependent oxidoreductase (luciferase family)
MCEHGEHHGRHGFGCGREHFGPGMGFGQGMHFRRRFLTREERIARLEEYLKVLQAEVKGVEEAIAEMKAAQ